MCALGTLEEFEKTVNPTAVRETLGERRPRYSQSAKFVGIKSVWKSLDSTKVKVLDIITLYLSLYTLQNSKLLNCD